MKGRSNSTELKGSIGYIAPGKKSIHVFPLLFFTSENRTDLILKSK